MNAYRTFRFVLPLVALALLGMAGYAVAAKSGGCQSFRVKGDFQIVVDRGSNRVVDLSGHATPGGSFTGQFNGKQFHDADIAGSITLDFGGGNTLTYYQELSFDPSVGLLVGTYTITGGTGQFAGASGSGDNVIVGADANGRGTFELDGTICL